MLLHSTTLPGTPGLITHQLAELLQWLWPAAQQLPAPVQQRAQRLWLDTVACTCSGLRAAEPQRWLAVQAQAERGDVPLPGQTLRLSSSAAAMAMALGACWDEACEGLALAHGRPGVPVVAALWSQIETVRPTWQALWQASAVGYEVAARLGARLRIKPGMHVDGVWGACGAAVALVHLRRGTWQDALRAVEACAAQLPFTLYAPVAQGANVRNLYLAHSAWLGLQAAQAVAAGLATPQGALDEFAALALAGAPAGSWPQAGAWLLLGSYWKPFAAVRHVHYGAQAAISLRAQGLQAEQIDELHLVVYPEALQYCANRAPATLIAAQFSLSFGVAAALVHGDLSPAEFHAPRAGHAQLLRLEALLQVRADAAAFPAGLRGAQLRAREAGRWWQAEQGAVTGDAGCEPSAHAVLAKFAQYTQAEPTLAAWAAQVLHDAPLRRACLPRQGEPCNAEA